jgi:hypothetical protein
MLLQTNSYIVPREKRAEHARLLRRFRQTLLRLGCDHFEVYEQVGANWNTGETTGRFVQILRFRDRKHQLSVQGAERTDPIAQALVQEFCELINFPYQQQQGLFAVGFYTSFLRMPTQRTTTPVQTETSDPEQQVAAPQSPEPGVLESTETAEYVPAEESVEAEGGETSERQSLPIEPESFEGIDFNASADSDAEALDGMTEEELHRAQSAIEDSEQPAEELPAQGATQPEHQP